MAGWRGDFYGVPGSWSGLCLPAGQFLGVVAGLAESRAVAQGCWAVTVPGDDVVEVADWGVAVWRAAGVIADLDEAAQWGREEPPPGVHAYQVAGLRFRVQPAEPNLQLSYGVLLACG